MATERSKQFTAWTISILLAFWMLFTGVPKLWGGLGWATRFSEWGYPTWMMFGAGLAEIAGAILILMPRAATIGGGILAVVMAGALITQLIFNGVAAAVPPIIALVMAGLVVGMRWTETISSRQETREGPRIINDPNV